MELGQKKKLYLHHWEYIFTVMVLLGFWAFSIGNIYGFLIFPDEFAYWSYAAKISGHDWSDITSLAPYYSYGYSLVLIPIFAFCKDAVVAYRIAVSVNFLFLFISYIGLTRTMKKIVPDEKVPLMLLSMSALFLPCNLFYTQMTLTEVFLLSLYIAAGSILFRYLENNRLSTLILFMLTLMYSYTVHMRTIGILFSGVITVFLSICMRKNRRWHIGVLLGMALFGVFAANALKQQVFLGVYGSMGKGIAADNDYSGQIEKIKYILTKEGLYDFLVSFLGKILYLGLATWGVFYWGVYGLFKQIIGMLQNGKKRIRYTPQQLFSFFVLLSVITQVGISTIYLLTLGEVSDYTYGRYNEMILPFVMVMGFAVLWKEKTRIIWVITGVFAVIQMFITIMVVRQINVTGADSFQGYFMVGMSYLYDENYYRTERFFTDAYLLCEALTLLVAAGILLCRSGKKKQYIVMAFIALELMLAVHADEIYLTPFKKAAFRDNRIADKINVLAKDGRRVIYMDEVFPSYIGIIQFMLRDMDIQVMERREAMGDYGEDIMPDDILIFAFDDVFLEEWEAQYANKDVYGHFAVLYN